MYKLERIINVHYINEWQYPNYKDAIDTLATKLQLYQKLNKHTIIKYTHPQLNELIHVEAQVNNESTTYIIKRWSPHLARIRVMSK